MPLLICRTTDRVVRHSDGFIHYDPAGTVVSVLPDTATIWPQMLKDFYVAHVTAAPKGWMRRHYSQRRPGRLRRTGRAVRTWWRKWRGTYDETTEVPRAQLALGGRYRLPLEKLLTPVQLQLCQNRDVACPVSTVVYKPTDLEEIVEIPPAVLRALGG